MSRRIVLCIARIGAQQTHTAQTWIIHKSRVISSSRHGAICRPPIIDGRTPKQGYHPQVPETTPVPWMTSVDIPMCCFPTEPSTTACAVPCLRGVPRKGRLTAFTCKNSAHPREEQHQPSAGGFLALLQYECAAVSMAGQTLGSTTPCLPRIVHSGLGGRWNVGITQASDFPWAFPTPQRTRPG